jgi:hypothetical protein
MVCLWQGLAQKCPHKRVVREMNVTKVPPMVVHFDRRPFRRLPATRKHGARLAASSSRIFNGLDALNRQRLISRGGGFAISPSEACE